MIHHTPPSLTCNPHNESMFHCPHLSEWNQFGDPVADQDMALNMRLLFGPWWWCQLSTSWSSTYVQMSSRLSGCHIFCLCFLGTASLADGGGSPCTGSGMVVSKSTSCYSCWDDCFSRTVSWMCEAYDLVSQKSITGCFIGGWVVGSSVNDVQTCLPASLKVLMNLPTSPFGEGW